MDKWSNAPLVDVAYVNMGQSPNGSTINDEKNGMPFLQGCADFGTKHPFERVWCSKPTRIAKEGDLLLSVRAPVGDTNIANQEYCIGRGLAAIRFNVLDGNFGAHAFSRDTHYLYIRSQGSTFQAVNRNDVESFPMFFPVDLDEQRRIAAVLTAADEAIDASSALVEKYAAVKQGLMQDLLSGRVRLAGFTGDWEQLKIGNLLDFKNGLNKGKEFFGTGIPIVNYMDVYTKSSIRAASLEGRVNLSKNEIKRFEVKKGDVFFTRTSETVNEVGYASVLLDDVEDGVFSGFVLRGRPKNDKLDIYYCQYCFSTQEIRRAIIVGATCTTRALTSGTYLSTIPILLPKPDEQRAIAEVIMAADERLTAERERLMKLEDIKRGLMDDLLTNRVSTDKLQGGI